MQHQLTFNIITGLYYTLGSQPVLSWNYHHFLGKLGVAYFAFFAAWTQIFLWTRSWKRDQHWEQIPQSKGSSLVSAHYRFLGAMFPGLIPTLLMRNLSKAWRENANFLNQVYLNSMSNLFYRKLFSFISTCQHFSSGTWWHFSTGSSQHFSKGFFQHFVSGTWTKVIQ